MLILAKPGAAAILAVEAHSYLGFTGRVNWGVRSVSAPELEIGFAFPFWAY